MFIKYFSVVGTLLASAISVPVWVYVGYFFGGDFKKMKEFVIDNTDTMGFLPKVAEKPIPSGVGCKAF